MAPFGAAGVLLWVLAIATPLASAWTDDDARQFRATGTYRNDYYGFAVVIPPGLRGGPNSPVGLTDHGIMIRMDPRTSQRLIDCYAAYNVLDYGSPDEAADAEVEYFRGRAAPVPVVVVSRRSTTLGGLAAVRVVLRYVEKEAGLAMVRDVTVALRRVMKASDAPSHKYVVSLETPQRDYSEDVKALDQVLGTWQLSTTADD